MKKSLLMLTLVFMVCIATAFCLTGCGKKAENSGGQRGPTSASITFVAEYNPAKTYDGAVAVAPNTDDYTTDSTGAVTIEWRTNTGTLLDSAPIDAGSYKVRVSVATTEVKTSAVSEYKSFTIAKRTLTNMHANREYNATNTGSYTFVTSDGIVGNDIVNCTFTYEGKDCGDKIESDIVIGGVDKDNYTIGDFESEITKKKLKNVSVSKEYDGTTDGNIALTTAEGIVEGDNVTCVFSYDVKDVNGNSANDPTVGGTDSGNYEIEATTFNAEITKKKLKNVSASKIYDRTTMGSYTFVTANGVVNSEVVTCTFVYDSKNVGTRTASDIQLSGATADNYEIDTETFVVDITKKAISPIINVTKLYDGTNAQEFTIRIVDGLIGGDVVMVSLTYADKNAGDDKAVSITEIKGVDKDNYDFAHTAVSGSISKKQINNITIVADKEYDGNNKGRYDLTTADGIISGDEVYYTFIYSGSAVDSTITGPKVSAGADKNNYSITYSSFTGKIV